MEYYLESVQVIVIPSRTISRGTLTCLTTVCLIGTCWTCLTANESNINKTNERLAAYLKHFPLDIHIVFLFVKI